MKADSCFAALRRVTKDTLKVIFDPALKLEFHGVKVTSDAGLLAY